MKPTSDPSHGLLACLADTSRFRLVSALTVGDRCVTELARDIGLSQSCTTRHLQALKQAGVVSAERQGKRVVYGLRADEPRVSSLLSWALDASTTGQTPIIRDKSRTARPIAKARRATSSAARTAAAAGSHSAPSAEARISATARSPVATPTPPPTPATAPYPPAQTAETGAVPETRSQAPRPVRSGDIEDFLL